MPLYAIALMLVLAVVLGIIGRPLMREPDCRGCVRCREGKEDNQVIKINSKGSARPVVGR